MTKYLFLVLCLFILVGCTVTSPNQPTQFLFNAPYNWNKSPLVVAVLSLDKPDVAEIFSDRLRDLGFTVFISIDRIEALVKNPDLIIYVDCTIQKIPQKSPDAYDPDEGVYTPQPGDRRDYYLKDPKQRKPLYAIAASIHITDNISNSIIYEARHEVRANNVNSGLKAIAKILLNPILEAKIALEKAAQEKKSTSRIDKPTQNNLQPKEPQVDNELGEKIDELISQLRDDDKEVREKAQEELIKIGKPAIPSLKYTVAKTKDEEAKILAKNAIFQINWPESAKEALEEYLKEIKEKGVYGIRELDRNKYKDYFPDYVFWGASRAVRSGNLYSCTGVNNFYVSKFGEVGNIDVTEDYNYIQYAKLKPVSIEIKTKEVAIKVAQVYQFIAGVTYWIESNKGEIDSNCEVEKTDNKWEFSQVFSIPYGRKISGRYKTTVTLICDENAKLTAVEGKYESVKK